uniref:Uncharacterized protein n=1 Tax=Ananas comosus var. bracteatus TaxID=296719 RepID=A0A6V7PWI7_ANACO|nr:unnamed protein product [Ananas comosus var. bracteatus]
MEIEILVSQVRWWRQYKKDSEELRTRLTRIVRRRRRWLLWRLWLRAHLGGLGEPAIDPRPHFGVRLSQGIPDVLVVPTPLLLLFVSHYLRLPLRRRVPLIRSCVVSCVLGVLARSSGESAPRERRLHRNLVYRD